MKNVILILGILFASKSYSAGNETFTVDLVGCKPSGLCFAGIKPNAVSTSCPSKSQIRFDITLPGSQALYSTLLTAFVSGKKIRVALTDNCIDDFSVPDWLHVNNS